MNDFIKLTTITGSFYIRASEIAAVGVDSRIWAHGKDTSITKAKESQKRIIELIVDKEQRDRALEAGEQAAAERARDAAIKEIGVQARLHGLAEAQNAALREKLEELNAVMTCAAEDLEARACLESEDAAKSLSRIAKDLRAALEQNGGDDANGN